MDETSRGALAPGAELGPYVIESRLGAGGMGEVYRARDKRLRRTVALKVLPPRLASTPGLRQRLEREAEAISSLNHPHICTLHDIGRQDEIDYLVMEFLEGETLAQRLKRGALPLAELLEFAIQIAGALEAAHAKGVIHRDIKPANIFIVGKGQIKVLDFGLAKLDPAAPAEAQSETVTMALDLTSAGTVVGTVAYMSPEQARGEEVDARTDLFSFGVVLYEMAAGVAPFRGASATLILDAILHATPVPPRQLKPELPAALEQMIDAALEKDRELRVQTAAEVRAALMRLKRDAQSTGESASTTAASAAPGARATRRTALAGLAGAALGAAGVGMFGIGRRRGELPRKVARFVLALPEGAIAEASHNRRVAISRDGTQVAYNLTVPGGGASLAANKFYYRSLRDLEAKSLSFPGGVPFFSPDGNWLGYFGQGPSGRPQMRKISLGGGAPVTLCDVDAFCGATWADDDVIYVVATSPGSLMRASSSGGALQEAVKVDTARGERQYKYPGAVFGSPVVLLTATTPEAETYNDARVVAVNVKTGQRKTLIEGDTHPRYSPSGHLVYAQGGNLLAVRFDPGRLAVSGQPFTVLEGVQMSVNSGCANFDISATGDLIYIPGAADKGERTLVWVDRSGKTEAVSSLPARSYLHPRISPDARQLAIEIEGPNHDFYVYDFARAVLARLTTDGESHWPVWSPDGSRLVYRSGRMMNWRMWQMPVDRSRAPQELTATGISQSAESWSPDGHAVAYTAATNQPGSHIMVASLEGDHQAHSIADIKAPAGSPKFSPDGKWLAYCSNESGKPQVYVQAYPGPGAKIQVSGEGGTDPVWKRAGGELYYRDADKMMAVAVSTASGFSAGRPQVLWQGHYSHGMSASCGPPGATSSNYDVTADGRRFLMIKDEAPDKAFSRQIVVALGWSQELTHIS